MKYIFVVLAFCLLACSKEQSVGNDMLFFPSQKEFLAALDHGVKQEGFISMNDYLSTVDLSKVKDVSSFKVTGLHIEKIDGEYFIERDVDVKYGNLLTKEGLVHIGDEVFKYGRSVSKVGYEEYLRGDKFSDVLEQRANYSVFSRSCSTYFRKASCSGNSNWKMVINFDIYKSPYTNSDGSTDMHGQSTFRYYNKGLFGIWFTSCDWEALRQTASMLISYDAVGGGRALYYLNEEVVDIENLSNQRCDDFFSNSFLLNPGSIFKTTNPNTLVVVGLSMDYRVNEGSSCELVNTCHIGI